MVQVSIDANGFRFEKNAKDGGGYGPVAEGALILPASATVQEIGAALRNAFSGNS